jgi:hypothetical protein
MLCPQDVLVPFITAGLPSMNTVDVTPPVVFDEACGGCGLPNGE